MSKRAIKAIADLLADPQNQEKTAEEIAEAVIEKVHEEDARVSRVAVVGQIQEGSRPPLTVVLGPFGARGLLDTPEKFLKATAGGTAARTAAEGLAWNPSTKLGRGRFMLAPILRSPREAWDFHRQIESEGAPAPEELAAAVTHTWNADLIEPACVCGMTTPYICRLCGKTRGHYCHRHRRGEEHQCVA